IPFRLKRKLFCPPPSPTLVPFTHSSNSSSAATIAAPVEGSSATYSFRNQTFPSGACSAGFPSSNQTQRASTLLCCARATSLAKHTTAAEIKTQSTKRTIPPPLLPYKPAAQKRINETACPMIGHRRNDATERYRQFASASVHHQLYLARPSLRHVQLTAQLVHFVEIDPFRTM